MAAAGDAAFEASANARGDTISDAEYKREMARVHARGLSARRWPPNRNVA